MFFRPLMIALLFGVATWSLNASGQPPLQSPADSLPVAAAGSEAPATPTEPPGATEVDSGVPLTNSDTNVSGNGPQPIGATPANQVAAPGTAATAEATNGAAGQELPEGYQEELMRRVETFGKKREELAKAVGDQRIMHILYLNYEKRTKADRDAYYQKRLEVRRLMDELYLLAVDVLRLGFEKESATYIVTLLQNRFEHCVYDVQTLEGAARLMDGGSKLTYVYQIAARSAITSGEFDIAKRVFESINEDQMEDTDKTLQFYLEKYQASFEREAEIRAKEIEEDRLPRVKIETTQGDVILELFLDQAPTAVSHFIGLVEAGFYDGNDFSQVVDNLFALSGDPSGTGSGNSGKYLADEHTRPDARDGFRGSLVMAKVPKGETGEFIPNTASSRFAILFLPIISISEQQTIFGRVVEGMENVSYLQRVDPFKKKEKGEVQLPPDRILKATVIRRPEDLPTPIYVDPLQSLGR
ncbi:MAG: peptidylprolyl isomerase [Planctomycetaceae bacterium]|nr:peptidylprolyl isomerase [Planctomycetaceae bacterium]